MYFDINVRLAEANTTIESIAFIKRVKQLALLSHYVYDFSVLSFEKLFIFF